MGKNNFVEFGVIQRRQTQQWIIKPKGLLIYNPIKQLFAKLKQKSWNLFSKKIENKQNGCSSEKERKVDALALRADEGRDNLR